MAIREAIDRDLEGREGWCGGDRKTSAQVGKHSGLIETQANTRDVTAKSPRNGIRKPMSRQKCQRARYQRIQESTIL